VPLAETGPSGLAAAGIEATELHLLDKRAELPTGTSTSAAVAATEPEADVRTGGGAEQEGEQEELPGLDEEQYFAMVRWYMDEHGCLPTRGQLLAALAEFYGLPEPSDGPDAPLDLGALYRRYRTETGTTPPVGVPWAPPPPVEPEQRDAVEAELHGREHPAESSIQVPRPSPAPEAAAELPGSRASVERVAETQAYDAAPVQPSPGLGPEHPSVPSPPPETQPESAPEQEREAAPAPVAARGSTSRARVEAKVEGEQTSLPEQTRPSGGTRKRVADAYDALSLEDRAKSKRAIAELIAPKAGVGAEAVRRQHLNAVIAEAASGAARPQREADARAEGET
ncbi:hypothetical protein, partial [Streptomyces nanshensis]